MGAGRIQYEAAAANAFGEVSIALVDRTKLVDTERQRARAVAAHLEAVRLANLRYASGPLGLLRGARGPAAAFPGRARPRPDPPRPAGGGGRPVPSSRRGLAGRGAYGQRRA